jgi:sulfotransferase
MGQKLFFIAGLPRSGSTLLSALLNQNPQIHAEPSSPLIDCINSNELILTQSEQVRAFSVSERVFNVCSQIPKSFYSHIEKPFVVDKNRNWTASYAFFLAKKYIDSEPKIVCCVRDVLEVLSSYVAIAEKNGTGGFIDELINTQQYFGPINDDRCDALMSPGGRVNSNLNSMKSMWQSEYKKNMLLVEYNDLVNSTQSTMDSIYKFWGIDTFQHELNVQEPFRVDDQVYGIRNLHLLKDKVESHSRNPEENLSQYVLNKYSNLNFWRSGK